MSNKGKRFQDDTEEIKLYKPKKNKKGSQPDEAVQQENFDEPAPAEETEQAAENSADRRAGEREERIAEKNSEKLYKLMKKQRSREEHSDREVLSYEDMPLRAAPEERSPAEEQKRRRRFTAAGAVILVAFLVVFIVANSDRLSLHNIANFIQFGVFNSDSDERFPIDIQGENVTAGNFQRMGQDLCYVSDTGVFVLNNYGKKLYSAQHSFTSPVLAVCDSRALIYSLGGTGYMINNGEETIFTGEAENNILVADIVNNGTYALVTQSDGYLSKLHVYDSENRKVFTYSFADYYITSVSLSSNGRRVVLSGLSALNGEEISALYVLDITKESPLFVEETEDNIIYQVQFLSDSYACAIGSNAACTINTHNGRVETVSYEGRSLTAFYVNEDTDTFSLSLSRSGDGRNCDIWSFRTNGTLAYSFETDLRVIYLSGYKGRVALLTTDSVQLYNKNGTLVSEKNPGVDPRAAVMYTGADVYVLDTSSVRALTL